jgi:hypothetical protein
MTPWFEKAVSEWQVTSAQNVESSDTVLAADKKVVSGNLSELCLIKALPWKYFNQVKRRKQAARRRLVRSVRCVHLVTLA